MDRYSNGSYIVKDRINNSYLKIEPLSKEGFEEQVEETKEEEKPKPKQEQTTLSFDNLYKESLKSVDDRMVVINNFLDDIEGK